jgi:hypothetical protein
VLPGRPPPVDVPVLHGQREVQQHPHERDAGVQRRGEDVVVPLPPHLAVPEHEEVEDDADQHPRVVVDGRRADEHRQVDHGDPAPAGERPVQRVLDDGARRADEEEPVERAVVAERDEDAAWADEAPDDGRVEEDAVVGARSRAVDGEERVIADVLDGAQQPVRHPEVDRDGDDGPDELHQEHGLGRDLHVVPELEVGEERHSLRHAHVAVHLEADVGDGHAREYESDDVLGDDVEPRRLVGGGRDDADGQREHEGQAAREEQPPPRKLHLVPEHGAEDERDDHGQPEQRVEPPRRHVRVAPHQPGVHVGLLVFLRGAEAVVYLPAVEQRDVHDGGRTTARRRCSCLSAPAGRTRPCRSRTGR